VKTGCTEGRSRHVTPRVCTEGEEPLADDTVTYHGAQNDHNQRGTAHARGKLACCASSRETASAVARSRVPCESRLRKVEVAPGTSRHDLAPRERGLSSVRCPSIGHGATTTRAARRVRQACVLRLLPRGSKRCGAPTRARCEMPAVRELSPGTAARVLLAQLTRTAFPAVGWGSTAPTVRQLGGTFF